MATKKKQSPRFTADEISILSGLVGKHKTIIECKKTDSVSSNLKNETWEKLCNEYNCLPGVSPRDSNQLKKCWGNPVKQKWKNERSDEKRKTHKTGGGPPPTPMSAISVLVGAVAGHMATRLDNDNDSDGAAYLPPVQNEPVVRLLEGMVDCDPLYDHAHTGAGSCSGRSGTNEPAQKVAVICNFVMQRMALTPGQQETPPQEPRPHLTVPVYVGYDDVKSVADFLGELQTYHLAYGASPRLRARQGFGKSSCLWTTQRRFSESSRQGRSTWTKVRTGDNYLPGSPSMDVAEPEASASVTAATGADPGPPTEQTVPAPAAASSCSSDRVAATQDEGRPARGRMVLLEQALSAENDVRSSLLRAESAIRIKLLEEEQQMKVAKHQMKVAEHRVRLQVEQTNLKIAEWKLRELQQGGEK
ncbi:uncharacterized protein ISCGN_014883 [Ixodes scapularis]